MPETVQRSHPHLACFARRFFLPPFDALFYLGNDLSAHYDRLCRCRAPNDIDNIKIDIDAISCFNGWLFAYATRPLGGGEMA
jgi:hypothetical protein